MKGIAIPYIIAIILGIAVVVVIGASFFGTSGNLNTKDCQNKAAAFCTVWRISGYGAPPSGGWNDYSKECANLGIYTSGIGQPDCDKILGRSTTTGTPATVPTSTDRTGKAGGPCTTRGACDSTDLKCQDNVCITK